MKKVILIVLLLIILPNVFAATIGVSPGRFGFDKMLRGGYAQQKLYITTTSSEDMYADLSVSGDIEGWVSFAEGNKVQLDDKNPTEITVIVRPPENAGNGLYRGRIKVMTSELSGLSLPEGGVGAVVRVAVDVLVTVEITDQEYFGCRAFDFAAKTVEKGTPLVLEATVLNEGNTKLKPTLTADIWDADQEKKIAILETEGGEILPTLQQKVSLEVPTLPYTYGQYWVDLKVPDCSAEDTLTFDILEFGSLQSTGVIERMEGKTWAFTGETIPVHVFFRNTGQKDVVATFKGDVKLRDKVVKVLESDDEVVKPGESADFTTYFTPKEAGRYVASGRVFYDKKRTFEASTIVNVNQKEDNLDLSWIVYAIIAAAVILVLLIRRERRKYRGRVWW